ncbi:Serpentine receptor class r-10 [Caenorhabditis elegans]|uniref:Serpentine receptor class r-10 n=1 Tax=Caenorhabditis elegans TaxID=6239 RepID=Q9GUD1_CAEEL|nr:Seven TM Receptor [Caenorhabditis elegans]CCD73118.1 Seven TM Receptor [Caenorhabditis elegans]|eukprot:NP_503220.1 Seven TM Receptor [Caenorhabditis elegans]
MLSPADWLLFEEDIQKLCGLVAIFSNLVLMYLILTKSPLTLGAYKWLMLYTALFELVYAVFNLFVGPVIHAFGSTCIVFQDMSKSLFDRQIIYVSIIIFCSFFGVSMAIFAVQFVYRYGAVNTTFKQKYLSGNKIMLLYICPIISGILWGLNVWIFMSPSVEKADYLRIYMAETFGLNIDECTYFGLLFWKDDGIGNLKIGSLSFNGVVNMDLILGTSFGCVAYFGINCYRLISQKLSTTESLSQATKNLQLQLFYALIVQSAIPCMFMYIPAAIIFTFPMINIDLDSKYPFVSVTIALYTAIDPLPTIFIIKDYRRAFFRFLSCKKGNEVISNYSLNGNESGVRWNNTRNITISTC